MVGLDQQDIVVFLIFYLAGLLLAAHLVGGGLLQFISHP